MKKDDFVREFQTEYRKETGKRLSFPNAKTMINVFINTMKSVLLKGSKIRFRGFGRFEFKTREGFDRRTYIKDGKKVPGGYMTHVDPHVVAYFKPSKKFNKELTGRLKNVLFDNEEKEKD